MNGVILTVTLREMVEKMKHVPDDHVFRWFQDSIPGPWPQAAETYRVTMGQVREELRIVR